MRLPDALSRRSFLSGFWQKRPLFMPQALRGDYPTLDAEELAWLATQDDVECRLVYTEYSSRRTRYRVRHGPFDADTLSALPERDWTLLVHDVDKHLPDFRAWYAAADFIPDWRIDDLMISFAAPGGSVGPHRDNYDVFLCQGQGRREWRLGRSDECIPDSKSGELSLLEPFTDDAARAAVRGDVLYLPPGVPHWGIAQDACITYSVGMRAPSLAELKTAAASISRTGGNCGHTVSPSDAEVHYADPDLSVDESMPGLIAEAAVQRAHRLLCDTTTLDDRQLAIVLGTVATETKAWLTPECPSGDEASDFSSSVERNAELRVHGMARIAYTLSGGAPIVFANGHAKEFPAACLDSIRDLCRERRATAARICADGDGELLQWLLISGVFDLTEPSHEAA